MYRVSRSHRAARTAARLIARIADRGIPKTASVNRRNFLLRAKARLRRWEGYNIPLRMPPFHRTRGDEPPRGR